MYEPPSDPVDSAFSTDAHHHDKRRPPTAVFWSFGSRTFTTFLIDFGPSSGLPWDCCMANITDPPVAFSCRLPVLLLGVRVRGSTSPHCGGGPGSGGVGEGVGEACSLMSMSCSSSSRCCSSWIFVVRPSYSCKCQYR